MEEKHAVWNMGSCGLCRMRSALTDVDNYRWPQPKVEERRIPADAEYIKEEPVEDTVIKGVTADPLAEYLNRRIMKDDPSAVASEVDKLKKMLDSVAGGSVPEQIPVGKNGSGIEARIQDDEYCDLCDGPCKNMYYDCIYPVI
jgi:hypothetical protein